MNTLKVKRLSAAAVLPAYAHPGDAGLDLFSAVSTSLDPGESKLIGTGISIELPLNTEGNFLVTCTECLRSFPVEDRPSSIVLRETDCVYCGSKQQFFAGAGAKCRSKSKSA